MMLMCVCHLKIDIIRNNNLFFFSLFKEREKNEIEFFSSLLFESLLFFLFYFKFAFPPFFCCFSYIHDLDVTPNLNFFLQYGKDTVILSLFAIVSERFMTVTVLKNVHKRPKAVKNAPGTTGNASQPVRFTCSYCNKSRFQGVIEFL